MVQNVNSPGSHTHSKTDFTGSLGYGNVHDVHDSDTAHQQGDSCHTTQKNGDGGHGGIHHAGDFLLRTDVEIILICLGGLGGILQLVVAAEDFQNLILSRLGCFLGNGRTYDSAQINSLILNSSFASKLHTP